MDQETQRNSWTYYCAVASCGHILFGNGTKLDFEHGADLVYFCSGASAFTSIHGGFTGNVTVHNEQKKLPIFREPLGFPWGSSSEKPEFDFKPNFTPQMTDLKVSSVQQDRTFVSANVGDTVTLRCFFNGDDSSWLFWYKQTLGQKPRLISSIYVYDSEVTFHDEFKNNFRFTLDTENHNNHLTIKDLQLSDSATYYCGNSQTFILNFAEGTVLSVKGSGLNIPALVHQSASESIQPGGSVTLNCTVHSGTCDGEHSVYWFKQSEESHPGLIYTHGDRNDQCERKPNTQTHTCVYNLPMKDLNVSHAGTYYCAVASCGHILFGNGTKLDIEHEVDSPLLVYFLSGALAFSTILVLILAFLVHKLIKRNKCQCADAATYYCASAQTYKFEFKEGATISVESSDLNIPALVHQSASESIQTGGSVTLNCTVHSGTCDGEHSVYWFKQSEESHPGLIYTHGDRNDQCERKPNTQTHTCVYNLPMKDLNVSHAWTYYCAVASCGHILFGDGTKLDTEHETDFVYFLSGALAFSIILVVFLAFSVYKMNKRNRCQSSEPHARYLAPSSINVEVNRDADNLHYAALRQLPRISPLLLIKRVVLYQPVLVADLKNLIQDSFTPMETGNDQCERKPNTQTHTCVYNLPMKDLNVSHSGTYYCAVASCGHILFGNGTKLDFEHGADLVYFCSGASAFTSILVVLLAMSVCIMSRKSCRSSGNFYFLYDYQKADNLYYAALSVDLKNRSRQRDQTWSECVYYSLKK
ncbi:hypothetical protein L3Q82_017031 [Scortum barcoo]|uniref:Uncharacterized protein n=1 Tax=Scortum barcoo TaxID=214431 RepID=A0ACB8XAR1_9TELE|nr:hypothetical protein L3Q82_017031 [Scortum barcoo]